MEIRRHKVRDASWGSVTRLGPDGRLTIDLGALLSEAKTVAPDIGWRADLAVPGEDVRITRCLDVLQPRWRRDGPTFPGWDGEPARCAARWEVVDGLAIIVSGQRSNTQQGVIDLFGPGAEATPFGGQACLVLCANAPAGLPDDAFDQQVRLAGLRCAAWIARRVAPSGSGIPSVLDWGPAAGLPRVGYVLCLQSQGLFRETFLYGRRAAEVGPQWLTPPEVLGGAVVSGNYVVACQKNPTYLHGENPVIHALLAEHGHRLNFTGVITAPEVSDPEGKIATARRIGEMAAEAGLRGAVVTQEGGGNADADLMLACRELVRQGIIPTLLARESAGIHGDAHGLVDWVEEAEAVVSTGNADAEIDLPAAGRVVTTVESDRHDLAGPLRLPLAQIYCAVNQLGALRLQAVEA